MPLQGSSSAEEHIKIEPEFAEKFRIVRGKWEALATQLSERLLQRIVLHLHSPNQFLVALISGIPGLDVVVGCCCMSVCYMVDTIAENQGDAKCLLDVCGCAECVYAEHWVVTGSCV